MILEEFTVSATIGLSCLALATYFIARFIIYDLFFHPLRKFPGPWLAKIGSFYEFYYDVVKDGTYLWEIEKMHLKYGPIVRINSRSLHIHDPEYYSAIYAGSGRRINKEPSAVAGFTFPLASISTIDHDLHRKRRAIVNPYFSRRAIVGLEPMINERLDALCSRLGETNEETIDLTSTFSSFTADVIINHFYGTCPDYISSKEFRFGLRDAITAILDFYNLTRFLPISAAATIKKLPLPLLRLLNPNFPVLVSARKDNEEMILKSLKNGVEAKTKNKSVIINALTDPSVPAEEKAIGRLLDEGETIIFAGIDTTARTLGVAMFHLLNNKKLLQKLRQQLQTLPKSAGPWTSDQLEALPFMRGVVQEALRLSYGAVVRIPRISTEEALQYKEYVIPPGTPVSQSIYLVNTDEANFPNPHSFDPERWVKAAQEGVNLDKYMVSFSKGSRGCLGINLAYTSLYLAIAKIASCLDMELVDTKQEDIEVYHTRVFAFPKKGSGAVKAKVIGVLE